MNESILWIYLFTFHLFIVNVKRWFDWRSPWFWWLNWLLSKSYHFNTHSHHIKDSIFYPNAYWIILFRVNQSGVMAIIQFIEALSSCHSQFVTFSHYTHTHTHNHYVSAFVLVRTRFSVFVCVHACVCVSFEGQVWTKNNGFPICIYCNGRHFLRKRINNSILIYSNTSTQRFVAEMKFVQFRKQLFVWWFFVHCWWFLMLLGCVGLHLFQGWTNNNFHRKTHTERTFRILLILCLVNRNSASRDYSELLLWSSFYK